MSVIKKNPATVATPIGGTYSHLAIVPRDADILVLSGQVGNTLEGDVPSAIEEQLRNALINVREILRSEDVDVSVIFKMNLWLTDKLEPEVFVKEWRNFFQSNPPAATLVYVTSLANPLWKIEIEAWAAR